MFAEAEDAIVTAIQTELGHTVRSVETLPGPWDQDALALAFRTMPGVWVYFDGGQPGKGRARLDARFQVYAVTAHASGGRTRQRGNRREIGAYDIVERVVPTLDRTRVDNLGTLQFEGLSVLTPASAQRKGVAVYEMTFNMEMGFPAPRDIADLGDFAIYHATHEVGDGPATETHIDLPTT